MNITYNVLLAVCGLSNREAALFHDARIDTVKSWASGRRNAPKGAIKELSGLVHKINNAVDEAIETFPNEPCELELGLASDNVEAQTLGWPFVSVHKIVLGLITSYATECGFTVSVVPRGSTVATESKGSE